jgi:glycerol uptake facilitator-like aquaporin
MFGGPRRKRKRQRESNGYGAHSPGGYSLLAALVCEVVMTMFFMVVLIKLVSVSQNSSNNGQKGPRKNFLAQEL